MSTSEPATSTEEIHTEKNTPNAEEDEEWLSKAKARRDKQATEEREHQKRLEELEKREKEEAAHVEDEEDEEEEEEEEEEEDDEDDDEPTSRTKPNYHANSKSPYLHVPAKPFKTVKDIGFAEEMNPRHRRTMEDGHCMIDGDFIAGDAKSAYFAIYDGHGGRAAVEHVQTVLHDLIRAEIPKTPEQPLDAIKKSYLTVDDQLRQQEIMYNGTTSITCVIRSESNGSRTLYTSNCGDARVVISHNGAAERLTYDHKASDESEQQRIREAGGFVAYNRVSGILSVTRALGDHAMKDWVLADPYNTTTPLTEKEDILILACDGLWDVFKDQEAVDVARKFASAQDAADDLLEQALKRGSTDNISIMIVRL